MKQIWSPWRSEYISLFNNKNTVTNNLIEKNTTCFICDCINSESSDAKNLIVTRKKECIVIMNKYPYNSGHILVCPNRHISKFSDFGSDELMSIMETIQLLTIGMEQLFNPHGFNIGINIGQSAGAGLPEHLHFHIVPRWNGDCNFISTIADIKIISEDIESTRQKLLKIFS